jgi:hypothetical protein
MAIIIRDSNGKEVGRYPNGTPHEQIAQEMKVAYKPKTQKDSSYMGVNIPAGTEIVDTIFGKMPKITGRPEINEKELNEMINAAAGAPGVGQVTKAAINKAMSIPDVIKLLKSSVDPRELIKKIQSGHDAMKSVASNLYNQVKDAAIARGIDKIPLNQKISDTINSAKEYMPKTKAFKDLFKKAEDGSYEALHKLQSSLGDRIRKLKGSKNIAEQDLGDALNDHRESLIDYIKDHFTNAGHEDLANDWQKARETTAKLHDIYYPKKEPMIGRIVHEDTRIMPKNPMTFLSKESTSMRRLMNEHPDVMQGYETYNKRADLMNKLTNARNVGLGGLGIYGTYAGGKTIYDLLKGT